MPGSLRSQKSKSDPLELELQATVSHLMKMFHGTITKELTNHEEWSHYNENIIEDKKDFVFVKYNGLHLKSLENLQPCISLRVCICSNNFITDIHPLHSCIKLIKLDLHGNQIKNLPDRKFWSGLKNLKLLYLHDNGFSRLKNICVLSACPSLLGLTMFDCPVSLKKGYRHVLVNSIWPLKALDYHVISDEEIIQNWHLPERFKTYNHRLFFNICPALRKGTTYEDEVNNIKYIISRINGILAHNSPVLIVQRWIRGYLVRKHLSPVFSYKKPQQKVLRVFETKWIYIGRGHEDKLFEDIIFSPETNLKGKLPHWKQNRRLPVDLKDSTAQRKHCEVQTKDIDRKSKSRHPIQKGQKFRDETGDEELETKFRISAFRISMCSPNSMKYSKMLKEIKQEYFPEYLQPLPPPHPKPIIKRETPQEKTKRNAFLTAQRAGVKLQALSDIDKYLSEQEHQKQDIEKKTAVVTAQVAKESIRLNVKESLSRKQYMIQKLAERDRERTQKGSWRRWKDKFTYIEKVRERRATFLAEKKLNMADHSLVQSINNERMHLLKGILKVDRMKGHLAELKEKHLSVYKKRRAQKYQQGLMKQMKELRVEEIRRKHLEEKFVIDTLLFQKACERLQDAKTNVEIVKQRFPFNTSRRFNESMSP